MDESNQSEPNASAGKGESLSGRKALVVGGSGGLGRSVSLALASEGAFVTVHGGSNGKSLAETVREIRLGGGRADGFLYRIEGDLSFVAEALKRGPFDILVVSFGPFVRKSLAETAAAEWREMALLNLALPGALVSSFAASMAERGWGRILLFGGTKTDTIRGFRKNAAYAAAKTGLGVLAKSVASEFAEKNVSCLVFCPGFVETEYLSPQERERGEGYSSTGKLIDTRRFAAAALQTGILGGSLFNGAVISADEGLSLEKISFYSDTIEKGI